MKVFKRQVLRKRKGMTLLEIIGVIVIIGILSFAVGTSVSKNIKRSNRETVITELQVFYTGLSDAYYDIGCPDIVPSASTKTDFQRWLSEIEGSYLAVKFDYSTITPTTKGFWVDVSTPLDVYENPYRFWFVTNDTNKLAMVVSGGDNGKIDVTGISSGDIADDAALIFSPRG